MLVSCLPSWYFFSMRENSLNWESGNAIMRAENVVIVLNADGELTDYGEGKRE